LGAGLPSNVEKSFAMLGYNIRYSLTPFFQRIYQQSKRTIHSKSTDGQTFSVRMSARFIDHMYIATNEVWLL
jgi:hypothetical protein